MSLRTDHKALAPLKAAFGKDIRYVKEANGETWVSVSTDRILDALRFLKESEELQYDYFSECLGVDYSEWTTERDWPGKEAKRFEVVYNLMSTKNYDRLFLKITVEDGESIPTAKDIFLGAEYPEREIQDLFGVQFTGNPEAKGMRFLLPDDWVGYPLRKEVPLGGEDVVFDKDTLGPAVEDISMPHAGESFEGRTGSGKSSGR